jgi:predicted metal-dependent hydrolase
MKMILPHDSGNILIDNIVRSKRKTLSISINPDLVIRVKAPYWVTNHDIEEFILKNSEWIKNKLSQMSKRPKVEPKKYMNGEKFLFLGKEVQLRFSLGRDFIITETDELLAPSLFADDPRDMIITWYKKQAEKIITDRCSIISKIVGVKPIKIKINSAKSRWGSCSRKGNLNFTWRLIMAPLPVVDYVVLHELVHLIHHNHSKEYWEVISRFMPNYMEAEKWLKNNHIYINI